MTTRRRCLITVTTAASLLAACSSGAAVEAPAGTVTTTAGSPVPTTPQDTTTAPAATVPATTTIAAGDSVPAELRDRWVGPPRTIGTLGQGTAAAFVEIAQDSFFLQTGIADNPKAFYSAASADGGDVLTLTLSGDVLDCLDGAIGHYHWSLSPQATTLTLSSVDDACAARQAAIEGNWTHTACKVEGRDCIGVAEAGTYSTNRFNPFGGFTYGELTFTLPSGWAVGYDSQAALFLRPADDYEKLGNDSSWGISAWADVAAAAQDCSDQPDPTVGLGAANIAAWMASLPSLNATRSTIMIHGTPAEVVDVEIAEANAPCEIAAGIPFVSLIASRTSKPDPFNFGVGGPLHMKVVLVDVLPERTVAIFLDPNDVGKQLQDFRSADELATVAMPIVESFIFSATPPTDT